MPTPVPQHGGRRPAMGAPRAGVLVGALLGGLVGFAAGLSLDRKGRTGSNARPC